MSSSERHVSKGFDGSTFKIGDNWLVTTPIPSIPNARVVDSDIQLKEGLKVVYDLVTILTEDGNNHEAINLKKQVGGKAQKPTPKQRDRNRQKHF